MKMTLSATPRAKSISCVTTIIVLSPDFNPLMTLSTSPVSSGSRAEVGSSKQSMSGESARARAIAMRCCCPPESSHGYALPRSPRPTLFKSACAFCSMLPSSLSLASFSAASLADLISAILSESAVFSAFLRASKSSFAISEDLSSLISAAVAAFSHLISARAFLRISAHAFSNFSLPMRFAASLMFVIAL